MVFDIPNDITHTYSERYTRLGIQFLFSPFLSIIIYLFNSLIVEESVRDNPYVQVAPRTVCRDTAHLEEFFQSIMEGGGEGIILRDPAAPYQPGRCPGYLKHKVVIVPSMPFSLFFVLTFDLLYRNIETLRLR